MDLLVGSPGGAQLELGHPVSQEGRVRVAVDETRKRHLPAPVHALVVPAGRKLPQDLRRSDREDALPRDGYRGGRVDAQCPELPAPERTRTFRGDGGREVVDQERGISHLCYPVRIPSARPPASLRRPRSLRRRRARREGLWLPRLRAQGATSLSR